MVKLSPESNVTIQLRFDALIDKREKGLET